MIGVSSERYNLILDCIQREANKNENDKNTAFQLNVLEINLFIHCLRTTPVLIIECNIKVYKDDY